MVQVCI